MNIKKLMPKDKFDIETAEKLKQYSFEEITPAIPELLEWLQDLNWPVSKSITETLIPFSENIALEILQILKGEDEMWKYWTLLVFGEITKNQLVLNEIKRISENPTTEEIDSETHKIAKQIIK